MTEEQTSYCSSKLLVWGRDLEPQLVTVALALEPDETHRRGDTKIPGRKDLDYKVGYWRRTIADANKSQDVDQQLEYWLEILRTRADELRRLIEIGCEFEIDCYIRTGPVTTINLSAPLLEELGKMGVRLSLTLVDVEYEGWRV